MHFSFEISIILKIVYLVCDFPDRLWVLWDQGLSLSSPLPYLSPCTMQSYWAFLRGNSKQEIGYTGIGQRWQAGLMKQPDISDSRKLLPPQGYEGHKEGMVSSDSEAEAVLWLGLSTTLDGGAAWWRAGTIAENDAQNREEDGKNNMASPYFSTSNLLLVPPLGHPSWKVVGKDKQEAQFSGEGWWKDLTANRQWPIQYELINICCFHEWMGV